MPVGAKTWQDALGYVAAMNSGAGTYGYTDWRLPNVNELRSLINADKSNNATWFNAQGFSNLQTPYLYWSSSTATYAYFTVYAWHVDMYNGYVAYSSKDESRYVWPVRSGQSGTFGNSVISLPQTGQTKCYDTAGAEIPCAGTGQDADIKAGVAWPNPRFIDHDDGTVTDNLTGLIWTKDANLPNGYRRWQEALDYVAAMNSGIGTYGYTDWRLPNVNEIFSLIDYSNFSPGFPAGAPFINVQLYGYWSSSTSAYNTVYAWYVRMGFGYVASYYYYHYFYVWPVRGGQTNETPTAITLSSFKAKQRNKQVLIKWKTSSEIDNLGFNILRSDSENGTYMQVNANIIPAKQNAVSGAKYKLKDRKVKKGNYFYKLEDIDSTSGSTVHDAVEVKVKSKSHKKKNKK